MHFLNSIPKTLKYVYKLLGIIQFSSSSDSKLYPRLWCIPTYLCFICSVLHKKIVPPLSTQSGLNEYFEILIFVQSVSFVCVSGILFSLKANNLKHLLHKIEKIEIDSIKKFTPMISQRIFFRFMLLISVALTVIFGIIVTSEPTSLPRAWIARLIYMSEVLFINDLLYYISSKFQMINEEIQKQNFLVPLSVIFPLTKVEKIKILEESDLSYKIKRIHEMSDCHYDLVHLTLKVANNFNTLIIFSLMLWFAFIIETIYVVTFMVINKVEGLSVYCFNLSSIFYLFMWLCLLLSSFNETQLKV